MRFSWEGIISVFLMVGSILLGSLAILELRGQTIQPPGGDLLTVENLLLVGFCLGIGIGVTLVTTRKLRRRRGKREGNSGLG
jgi:hypothetical protein